MSVGSTETGWEIGISFRGFASLVSVMLNKAFLLLQSCRCHCFQARTLVFRAGLPTE